MRPAERITVIKETATLLSEQEWSDIDLTLGEHDLPTTDSWNGSKYNYVIAMLDRESDEKLREVHEFVTGEAGDTPVGPHPWRQGYFKLFLSHLAVHQEQVSYVGHNLRRYGVSSFVAHSSITPSTEWQTVIEVALRTSDAMAVFLHNGFKESDWCDQEVGFALARRVPILPLAIDVMPYGFMGKLQAARCRSDDSAPKIAERILRWLLKTPATQTAMTDGLVTAFERSGSFSDTRSIYNLLVEMPVFTPAQLQRLEGATKENDQVSGTVGRESKPMPDLIQKFISQRGGSPENAHDPWSGEPPF
jgi:hypothetical protein